MVDSQNIFPNQSQPVEVHTMPDKFMTSVSSGSGSMQPKKGNKASWIIIAIIILAVIGILGGAGYLIYTNLPSKQTQQLVNEGKTENQNTQIATNANSNKNSNENENANSNANSNKNSNENENANSNANSNKNSNENENANSNANSNKNSNENENANSNANVNKQVKKASDNDIDGLTDAEEKIFNTKVDKPDTDEDGFKDGAEVINNYNPNGTGSLGESSLVKNYQNTDFNYTIIYPKDWILESVAEDNKNAIFTPNDMTDAGEFIEIITDTNPYGFDALNWYLDQNSDALESQIKKIEVNGQNGVLSVDGYTAYFADDNNIYAIHYNYGNKTELNFSTIFQMMYKNFKLSAVENTNTNTNSNTNQSNININKANSNTNLNNNTNLAS